MTFVECESTALSSFLRILFLFLTLSVYVFFVYLSFFLLQAIVLDDAFALMWSVLSHSYSINYFNKIELVRR